MGSRAKRGKVERRSDRTRNAAEYQRIQLGVRAGEQPLNRAERRAAGQRGKSSR